LFLLFFGFNFLKGVNIFSPTNSYHGVFADLHGLEEQAPVYIRGHKVGQVDAIHYDFAKDSSFVVDMSVKKDIALPEGTRMYLIADGLLGGKALDLRWTTEDHQSTIDKGSFLPTAYEPTIVETLQGTLLAHLDEAVQDVDKAVHNVDSLVASLQGQVAGNHLKHSLANIDRISGDLTSVSADLKDVMATKVPRLLNNADTAVSNINTVVADLKSANLKATVARVDTAVENINSLVSDVRGPLLSNINSAVISADSLLVDLKAHPKRYVHFSVFGKKDK
jgi:phospholipid/cholesterol/gamma-HCH transport system substrate-binding protein